MRTAIVLVIVVLGLGLIAFVMYGVTRLMRDSEANPMSFLDSFRTSKPTSFPPKQKGNGDLEGDITGGTTHDPAGPGPERPLA